LSEGAPATETKRLWIADAGAAASVDGEAMPHVCILRCSDGTLSIGSTIDLDRRTQEHNAGLGAAFMEGGLDAVIGWSARHRAGKRDEPGVARVSAGRHGLGGSRRDA
jgi:hypothetical protein